MRCYSSIATLVERMVCNMTYLQLRGDVRDGLKGRLPERFQVLHIRLLIHLLEYLVYR